MLDTPATIRFGVSGKNDSDETISASAYCWMQRRSLLLDVEERVLNDRCPLALGFAAATALISQITRLGSPRTLSMPTAKRFGFV